MKTIFLTLLLLCAVAHSDDASDLWWAICEVESHNGRDPITYQVNPVAGELGIAQITPIMVDECNRILKKQGFETRYTLDDRLDDEKSRYMFWIYTSFWLTHYKLPNLNEWRARLWNRGPTNYMDELGTIYWNKVHKNLPEQIAFERYNQELKKAEAKEKESSDGWFLITVVGGISMLLLFGVGVVCSKLRFDY